MLNIYIGHDKTQERAYRVCKYSIERHLDPAGRFISIFPIDDQHPLYRRICHEGPNGQRIDTQDGKPFSTDFSFARFLVPAIQNYGGWAIFVDSDFLFLGDINELADHADVHKAVLVVKHEHRPSHGLKMDGKIQSPYPRKNWSSLILWNCGHEANRELTPEIVNHASGHFLHGFQWLDNRLIGELPAKWNHLVDYDPSYNPKHLKALHYTQGGPWFERYRNCSYADLWIAEWKRMKKEEQWPLEASTRESLPAPL